MPWVMGIVIASRAMKKSSSRLRHTVERAAANIASKWARARVGIWITLVLGFYREGMGGLVDMPEVS